MTDLNTPSHMLETGVAGLEAQAAAGARDRALDDAAAMAISNAGSWEDDEGDAAIVISQQILALKGGSERELSRTEREQFLELSTLVTQGTMAAALRSRLGRYGRPETDALMTTIKKGADLTEREIAEFFWLLGCRPSLELTELEQEDRSDD